MNNNRTAIKVGREKINSKEIIQYFHFINSSLKLGYKKLKLYHQQKK